MTSEQIEITRLRAELRAASENVMLLEREAERLRISNVAKLDEATHWRKLYASELEEHDRTRQRIAPLVTSLVEATSGWECLFRNVIGEGETLPDELTRLKDLIPR